MQSVMSISIFIYFFDLLCYKEFVLNYISVNVKLVNKIINYCKFSDKAYIYCTCIRLNQNDSFTISLKNYK